MILILRNIHIRECSLFIVWIKDLILLQPSIKHSVNELKPEGKKEEMARTWSFDDIDGVTCPETWTFSEFLLCEIRNFIDIYIFLRFLLVPAKNVLTGKCLES